MDANALRISGIVVSSALMAAALAIALQPAPQAAAQTSSQSFEIAQAPAQAAPISFLVRFRGSGPIARAQRQAASGEGAEAQRQLQVQLRRQERFHGLCFDRFTAGAAEVVLRTCAAIVPSERAAMERRWLARLRSMGSVAYVDINTTASQGRTG